MEGTHGVADSRFPRVLWVTGLVALLLLAGGAAQLIMKFAGTQPVEEEARLLATRRADLVTSELRRAATDDATLRQFAGPEETDSTALSRMVSQRTGVEVLLVQGADHRRTPGLRMLFRVRVGLSRDRLTGPVTARVDVCFRQSIDPATNDFSRVEVVCPMPTGPAGRTAESPTGEPPPDPADGTFPPG